MPPKPNAPCSCGSKKKYKKCCKKTNGVRASTQIDAQRSMLADSVDHFQFINVANDINEPIMADYHYLVGSIVSAKKEGDVIVKFSISEPHEHLIPPPLPCFAIEIPTLKLLGPKIDVLTYGGYENANLLQHSVLNATTTIRAKMGIIMPPIGARPDNFNNVPTKWVQNMCARKWVPPIWFGGSSEQNCEILVHNNKNDPILYQHCQKYDHSKHNPRDNIIQHRPTLFLFQPDPTAAPGSIESITKILKWEHNGDIGFANLVHNRDGTTNAEEQNREGPNPNNILRAFFCAVDCHDIPSCITLFRYAETAAYQTGQLVQFANALDRFNQMAVTTYYHPEDGYTQESHIGFVNHPSPESDFAYYAHQAGEAHEAAAALFNKTNKDRKNGQLCNEEILEMKRAVCSYKFGALLVSQRHCARTIHPRFRSLMWGACGVAIRRYAGSLVDDNSGNNNAEANIYFNMAERAYRWSASVLKPFVTMPHPVFKINKNTMQQSMQSTLANLRACAEYRTLSAKDNRKGTKSQMRQQRKESAAKSIGGATRIDMNGIQADGVIKPDLGNVISLGSLVEKVCACCGLNANQVPKLHRCGSCKLVYFCSRTCQKKMWPKHKADCRVSSTSAGGTAKKKKKQKGDDG